MTPDEKKDLVMLIRFIAAEYDLEKYTVRTLKRISKAVKKAEDEMYDFIMYKGSSIKDYAEERLLAVLDELSDLTIGIQNEITGDIAKTYGEVGAKSYIDTNNILSFDGEVSGFKTVGLSSNQLSQFALKTKVGGDLLNNWVTKSFDIKTKGIIREEILTGRLKGESTRKIIDRLNETLDITKRELTTLTRTYIQSANVNAQKDVFKKNKDIVIALKWSATLEGGQKKTGRGTCLRCAFLDGQKFNNGSKKSNLPDPPPCPLHPNCRCILVPVTPTFKDLGLDIEEIDDAYRVYYERGKITKEGKRLYSNIGKGNQAKILETGFHQGDYKSWFIDRPDVYQRNTLGPVRYDLWKSKKISLDDLVTNKGDLVPIKDL